MKNFPDQNQFDELEKRLRDYSEQPDELVWKNIDAALRPDRTPYWLPWVDRATAVAAVLLFAFVVAGTQSEKQRDHVNVASANEKEIRNSKEDILSFEQKEEKIKSLDKSALTGSDPRDTRPRLTSGKNDLRSSRSLNSKFVGSEVQDSGLIAANMHGETTGQSTVSVLTPIDSSITSMLTSSADSIVQEQEEVTSSKRIPKRRHKYYMSVTPSLSFQRAIPVSDEIVVNDFLNSSVLSGERFGFSIETGIQGYLSRRWEYYGLSIFIAETKVKEIGIRKVFGASVSNIVGILSLDFIKLVLIAFILAVPIGYYAMDAWLENFAYKIDLDATLFVMAGVLSLGVAGLTTGYEAIKAALRNPVDSIRNE